MDASDNETSPSRPAAIRARRVQQAGQQMQAFGQFQLLDRSAVRTRLRPPADCRSTSLAAVRRRLVACDGIVAVKDDPATHSLVICHCPTFRWSSIGAAAWRLDETEKASPAPAAAAARPTGPAPHQPLEAALDKLVLLVLNGVIGRRPAEQIVQDVALGFLAIALRESRRA